MTAGERIEEVTARFDALRERARHRRVAFVRDIKSEVVPLENDEVLVTTRLLDEYHDMAVALLVDEEMVIRAFAARDDRVPYPVCAEAVTAYEAIVGLHVFQRGILREIRSRVERVAGCTHLMELIEASLRTLFAALYNIRREVDLRDYLELEEMRQVNLRRPVLRDTCRAFRLADADERHYEVALEKLAAAGIDPERIDPHNRDR